MRLVAMGVTRLLVDDYYAPAKDDNIVTVVVCLSVCLLVNNFAQKLLNGFA